MPVHDGNSSETTGAGDEEDVLSARALAVGDEIAHTMFGPVEWVGETGSTNEDLLARAAAGAPHGLVRVADHQTAGRGRRDRTWTDTPGDSLLVSVLLRPSGQAEDLSVLTSAFAVSAAEACDALGCPGSSIKWPNDLVVGPAGEQRKLAGILAQSQVGATGVAVVIGLGLNIRSEGLAAFRTPAVALDQLGVPPTREELVVRILQNANRRLASLQDDPESMWRRYRGRSATLGTLVEVELDRGSLRGRARAVTGSGALVVEVPGGEMVDVYAGDVVSVASPATGLW